MIARYTRSELSRLWSDDHRYDIWLRIELAACEAMEAVGSVPAGTAAAVRAKAAGKLSAARILEHRGAHAPRRHRVPDATSRSWRASRRAGCTSA